MKKNAVGHILYHKEPVRRRVIAMHLLERFLCLLLALILWLVFVNAKAFSERENPPQNGTVEETV